MALYIENGWIGTPDKEEALELFQAAACSGHYYSEKALARRLLKGWGGVSGLFEGLYWLLISIKNGYRLHSLDDWSNDSLKP